MKQSENIYGADDSQFYAALTEKFYPEPEQEAPKQEDSNNVT